MSAPWRAAILWLAWAASAAAGEPESAAFFGRLHGEWQGTGEVRGMTAEMRMRWQPALDGQFHTLSMKNRMTGKDGQIWVFEAQAYYRVHADGKIAGTWFDSRGISLPLTGRVEGGTLTIDWGTPAIERGRSSYALAADTLEVTDEVYGKDGALAVFGRTRLARK